MEEKEWLFHVVLVEPEIPPNTGNIARTCAITGMKLHLVKPLGFSIDDKAVKRAGLDYWDHLELEVHESLGEFLEKYKDRKMYLATTHGGVRYTDVRYERGLSLIHILRHFYIEYVSGICSGHHQRYGQFLPRYQHHPVLYGNL